MTVAFPEMKASIEELGVLASGDAASRQIKVESAA